MTQPTVSTAAGPRRFQLPSLSTLGPLIALLIAVIIFSTQSPRFFSGTNFSLILQQISYTAVLAIGQTLIILIAGIDLSIGIVMALGGLVMAKLATESGVPAILAILAGFVTTMFFGFISSIIITRLRVPPFIATLGMLGIVTALNQTYSGSQTISNLPPALTALGNTFKIGGTAITYGTVLMLVLYLIAWFVLSETAPGRHVYAVGNNPEAARLSGIPIDRLTILVYTIAGLIYGVAALILVARTGVGDPNAGQTDNLDSITAVVLGGTSLFGGRGNVLGTLLGAIIVGVFRNGLQLIGIPSVYQSLITGILIIAAVALDQISRRKA
ncbi:ABC transporter permease [Deinococcus sp. KNUC1210]|uniref:ABC transporter permease n=1 Tax=Deinococcus sp. KNUC1210 TaxID=2917691 RepID=UPI001EF07827|nr:ABC transporter permease [Deinococcus sp. KNUC1210]ULH14533.1 ABC transporter permease [Deinococcus sp. KNUC1210]